MIVLAIFILINNRLHGYHNIMKSIFSKGKELYESILIIAKL